MGPPKKKEGLAESNGSAPKCTIIKAGSVIAVNLTVLPKKAGQLILMRIWVYACFPVSSVVLMNGIILTK